MRLDSVDFDRVGVGVSPTSLFNCLRILSCSAICIPRSTDCGLDQHREKDLEMISVEVSDTVQYILDFTEPGVS